MLNAGDCARGANLVAGTASRAQLEHLAGYGLSQGIDCAQADADRASTRKQVAKFNQPRQFPLFVINGQSVCSVTARKTALRT